MLKIQYPLKLETDWWNLSSFKENNSFIPQIFSVVDILQLILIKERSSIKVMIGKLLTKSREWSIK